MPPGRSYDLDVVRRLRIGTAIGLSLGFLAVLLFWKFVILAPDANEADSAGPTQQPTGAESTSGSSPAPGASVTPNHPVAIPPKPVVPPRSQAEQLLGELTVARTSHSDSYDRLAFGDPFWWTDDVDSSGGRNGCDTRDDVIRRDLTNPRIGDRNTCLVFSGTLHDPYTGNVITYNRYEASDIEIDHIVALGAAWRSGAWAWTPDKRRDFANDLNNLQATDKQVNQDKVSSAPDRWKPPDRSYWCAYAGRWISIKSTYGLTVTSAEMSALEEMLATCA